MSVVDSSNRQSSWLLPALRQAYTGTIIACGSFDQDKAEAILQALTGPATTPA